MPDNKQITTEQAMRKVLAAEQNAKQVVADCERDAQHLLEQARQKAVRIIERSNARIAKIKQHCNQAISEEILSIQSDVRTDSTSELIANIDAATRSEIVVTLAELLTTDAGHEETE